MIKLFWLPCGDRGVNFGDAASSEIVKRLSRDTVERVKLSTDAQLVAAGSVLHHLDKHHFTGHIWGAGCMREEDYFYFPRATVCAVRGYLTANRLDLPKDFTVGDPLLLWETGRPIPKKYRLGIVPHYVDFSNPVLWGYAKASYPHVLVIDIESPDAADRIASCEHILSSSLHGLVLADAMGIPNRWTLFSDGKIGGGSFKFRDYYSAFNINDPIPYRFCENDLIRSLPGSFTHAPDMGKVFALREGLKAAFPAKLKLVSS